MRLDRSSWQEVGKYLARSTGIIIPAGSTEQHGPIGLIGTDTICADIIAQRAASLAHALVAPALAYSPAPFNLGFPGTVSIEPDLFEDLAMSLCRSLAGQGFAKFYFLNGHGANLEPLGRVAERSDPGTVRVRSWWDFAEVQALRQRHFGAWEGMHATPSEISVTRVNERTVESELAARPPERLSDEYIRRASGDRHGPPEQHRRDFPDGRVGSHSALASAEIGKLLIDAAGDAAAADYLDFAAR